MLSLGKALIRFIVLVVKGVITSLGVKVVIAK